ncbi:uncharacterized protein [Ptychodera flava]|uniref:uncharacterized protein n=1 Tax=Ptychodera flava TaxID=63121 RepID=UPI00396A3B00
MAALADISDSCWQYIKYDCYGSILKSGGSNYGAWFDRSGNAMVNWAGAPLGQTLCACGSNGNCDNGVATCSCDNNDNVWRYDEGTITDKDYLPVTKLGFGDTGDSGESGYHTLGALYCRGDASTVLSSRSDFLMIPDSYISGHDNEQVSTSVSDCADRCASSTSFVCRSFDFDLVSSICYLSEYNHVMAGGIGSSTSFDLYITIFDAGTNLFVESNNCNSGWVEYDSMCYYPSTSTMNWYDAETWCQSQGGHLTSTANDAEYAFLRQMLRWSLVTTYDFLIGYNDIEEEGVWAEADGTQHSFTRWLSGEPNGGALENAVVMYARSYDGWADVNVESGYQFICKASSGASAIAQPTTNPSCPNGWISSGDSCYFFSSATETFDNAQDDCKSMNSDLLIIDDDNEWTYVYTYIRYRYYTRNYWVGLTDVLQEGTWVWENGVGEATGTSYWIAGAPDNSGGSEHCARLDQYYGYEDVGCTTQIYYICEDDLYLTSFPTSISADVKSPSTVTITWSDISQTDGQNGDIVGYKVCIILC